MQLSTKPPFPAREKDGEACRSARKSFWYLPRGILTYKPKDLNRDCGRPVLSTLRDNETRLDPNENGQKIELWRVVETVFVSFELTLIA